MSLAILQVVGSALGIFLTWYVGRQAVKWLQWFRTKQQLKEQERLAAESADLARRANERAEQLRKIEGR